MADNKPKTTASRKLVNSFKGLFTKNTAVFSFCILVAFVLWLLNALSKEYEGRITATLQYSNLPEDKVLVEDIRDQVQLHVRAVGFNLLWSKLDLLSAQINLDYSNYANRDYLVVEDALTNLSERLAGSYTLLNAYPDTIHFHFDVRAERKVPVRLKHDISFAKQFYFSDSIALQPDSVTVSGPKSVVDTIAHWPTVLLEETDVNQSLSRAVALAEPRSRSMRLSPATVNCRIPVEQYTERQVQVHIRKRGVPRDVEVVILPNKVTLTFLVGLSDYEQVDKDQFDVVADFSTIDINKNKEIEVSVREQPSSVRKVSISPETVNYIIYK